MPPCSVSEMSGTPTPSFDAFDESESASITTSRSRLQWVAIFLDVTHIPDARCGEDGDVAIFLDVTHIPDARFGEDGDVVLQQRLDLLVPVTSSASSAGTSSGQL